MENNNKTVNHETVKFSIEMQKSMVIRAALSEIKDALEEKGYNPVNQIVGYIMSGDPTYITSYKDARLKIKKFDRDELLEELVGFYLKGEK
ncbi:MAG: IreB family regulatory phosphoprotein [Anaerofustis stercorihominis]|nr:IreB family regulatory phosphoprotein [Anaerofustis stercorihominis]